MYKKFLVGLVAIFSASNAMAMSDLELKERVSQLQDCMYDVSTLGHDPTGTSGQLYHDTENGVFYGYGRGLLYYVNAKTGDVRIEDTLAKLASTNADVMASDGSTYRGIRVDFKGNASNGHLFCFYMVK